MDTYSALRSTLLCLALPCWLSAQHAALGQPTAKAPAAAVPLHATASDGGSGAPTIWAAGTAYKASFHDGFVFYAALGKEAPRNLPLRWTTELVQAGTWTSVVPAAAPRPVHTEWRCEYRHPGLREIYDVRPEGVEQSFVIEEAPPAAGDLTITGRVDTELRAAAAAAAHQALTFEDGQGREVVRYGAAIAFDAAGRRTPVTTSWDGAHVELTVPGAWLAGAVWPVTVDPLTTPVINVTTLQDILAVDVAYDTDAAVIMVCYTYAISSTDYDARAYVMRNDLQGLFQVFSDLTLDSSRYAQCCYVGGANRWLIACTRVTSSGASGLFVYQHASGNYSLNTGVRRTIQVPSDRYDSYPTIGGSFDPTTGTRALLAWQRDSSSIGNNDSQVWACVIDATTTVGIGTSQQFRVKTLPADVDQQYPCVNKCSQTGDWVVVHQERDNNIPGDNWDVEVTFVGASGAVFYRFPLGGTANKNRLLPKIDGSSGRYFVSYTDSPVGSLSQTLGDRVMAMNFDWTGVLSRVSSHRIQAADTERVLTTGIASRPIAYDRNTGSHAVVGYFKSLSAQSSTRAYLNRIGFAAEAVEAAELAPNEDCRSAAVTYHPDLFSFVAAYPIHGPANRQIRARYFDYADASAANYGTGCAGSVTVRNGSLPPARSAPHRGSVAFGVGLTGGLPNQAYYPLVGAAQGSYPLGSGCTLLLDPAATIIALPAITSSAGGSADLPLAIPDAFVGDVYFQWLALTLNGFKSSTGLRMRIR